MYRSAGDQSDNTSNARLIAGLYSGANTVFEISRIRYSNTKSTQTYHYILTKSGASNKAIIQLNKNTGEVENTIELTDKTPNYVIDEYDNRVFLNQKNHLIS